MNTVLSYMRYFSFIKREDAERRGDLLRMRPIAGERRGGGSSGGAERRRVGVIGPGRRLGRSGVAGTRMRRPFAQPGGGEDPTLSGDENVAVFGEQLSDTPLTPELSDGADDVVGGRPGGHGPRRAPRDLS